MSRHIKLASIAIAAGMFAASPLHAQVFSGNPTPPAGTKTQNSVQPTRSAPTPVAPKSQSNIKNNSDKKKTVTFIKTDPKKDQELIFMYMDNFSIYRSPSGQTRCSAKFSVITTLPTKLSSISYRLQWPKMETVLSFNDVEPDVENYYNYSLLGDGCYSMDKIPNIVINRCRVKGMSQQTCASKVKWITKIK